MRLELPVPPPPDLDALERARRRQASLTKPPGSLGRLEELSLQLAAATGLLPPPVARKAVLVMAADHGVAEEGVSAYPAEVTAQMVGNFLRGGAAINVLARLAGARVTVADLGVRGGEGFREPLERAGGPGLRLVRSPIGPGTANMARGPAMSREEAERALRAGLRIALEEVERGLDMLATGDMGIGNTTAASALVSAFTGLAPRAVTGRGTGVDDRGLERKIAAIERALAVNRPDPRDPLDVLSKVGGFEIAGLAGAILGAASRRVPVVVDGFISGAAALVASEIAPQVKPYLIAAHRSVEVGHGPLLERLSIRPLLSLELRLGEGTGAVLAFHLIEAAARILGEMATFAEAGVAGRS
jgi:nicotinate-nucleotide--dimethylbenzimidazole phosphoribosyltransferase